MGELSKTAIPYVGDSTRLRNRTVPVGLSRIRNMKGRSTVTLTGPE